MPYAQHRVLVDIDFVLFFVLFCAFQLQEIYLYSICEFMQFFSYFSQAPRRNGKFTFPSYECVIVCVCVYRFVFANCI